MIWITQNARQVRPLDSLRDTSTHRRQTEIQFNSYQHQMNWRMIGSAVSLIIFLILLLATVAGVPAVLVKINGYWACPTTTSSPESSTPAPPVPLGTNNGSARLCTANASWNPIGVTVAGLSSGLPSASLAGLQNPNDMYVYDNGTVLVADLNNNRIMKWDVNATVGEMVAGTGFYGSWINLLARPLGLAVLGEQLFVSDRDNYRIQVFPLDTNVSSPDAETLIGRYGQGPGLNQINQVARIVASKRFPLLLYLSDSANHRILRWDFTTNTSQVVAGISNVFGFDSVHLDNPFGMAFDERTNALYIADQSNNRIQKYDMNGQYPSITVAGWGQLNAPAGIQLDSSGMNMFIADTLNHRVLLWLNRALQGRIIAGNGFANNSMFQLNTPTQIQFDSNYNLYVADTGNSRIQRFDLISNGC